MPAKSVTYNSQNYAGTLGSGLAAAANSYILQSIAHAFQHP